MNKEITTTEKAFMATADLKEVFSEEMEGLTPNFEKIKIPAGGGIAYEVPGDDPESPDTVKEFSAVIIYHHPYSVLYKEKYTGGANPPDCGSSDGKFGIISETGEIKDCSKCEYNKFGSSEDGKGKACKQKRRIFLLRENEALPVILNLPTGSLGEFSKYIMRLMQKGKKSNSVVTRFSLKKAQNSGGINYSQAVFACGRDLSKEEFENISMMSEQVKSYAKSIVVAEEEE